MITKSTIDNIHDLLGINVVVKNNKDCYLALMHISPVHEIFQARILECIAISFSRGLLNTGIKPGSLALQADSLPTELQGKP